MLIKNIKNIALGIGIMFLLPIVTSTGTQLIVPYPTYEERDNETYKDDINKYGKYFFYINTITGIALILAGAITPIPFINISIILGGVLCLIMGQILYGSDNLSKLIKFISLLISLLVLVLSSFISKSRKHDI